MEGLGSVLMVNSATKGAFRSLAGVLKEITDLVNEQNKGMARGLRELFARVSRLPSILTEPSWRALVELRFEARRAEGETQEGKGGTTG